jgi:hypothetical protein
LLALGIAAIKLFMVAGALFARPHAKHWLEPFGYLFAAALCLSVMRWPIRRIRALGAVLRKPTLEEPTVPPDFSTLSDGSQRWTNLEQL